MKWIAERMKFITREYHRVSKDRLDEVIYGLITDGLRAAQAEQRRKNAEIARDPYGDEVQALAEDEPKTVGNKIADAITQEDG